MVDRAAVVPDDERPRGRARAHRVGHRVPRRRRHSAARRRDRPRPLLRAGLRARTGPVLGDGLPPPRHRRPTRRAVRRGDGRRRFLHSHARLARHRRARVRAARPRVEGVLRRLRRRRERLPGRARRSRPLARVRRARPAEPRVRPRAVVAHRLDRVAQGHGLGPALEPRRRDRPSAARHDPDARGDRLPAPRVPVGRDAHDRRRAARRGARRDVDGAARDRRGRLRRRGGRRRRCERRRGRRRPPVSPTP